MPNEPSPTNLDRLAAKIAQALIAETKKQNCKADEVDNLVTKTLGVLQEEGVYACMLFLFSRSQASEKVIAKVARDQALNLISELPFDWQRPANQADAALQFIVEKVTEQTLPLLLAKETLEQMLIYARYGAKAWKAA